MPIISIEHDTNKDNISVEYNTYILWDKIEWAVRHLTIEVSDGVFELLQWENYIKQCHKILNNN